MYLIHNPMFIKDLKKDWHEFERIKEDGLSKCVHHGHGQIAPPVI